MKKLVLVLVLLLASFADAAINWSTEISNVNVTSKRASVAFTRTDTEKPDDVWVVSFQNVILETQAQRIALLDLVWTKWQDELANRAAIEAFITNLEQQANSNLEAREQ